MTLIALNIGILYKTILNHFIYKKINNGAAPKIVKQAIKDKYINKSRSVYFQAYLISLCYKKY